MADSRTVISLDDVRHVAKLSRLAVDEKRLPELARKLEPILGYISQIGEVDVAGVEPMAHAVPLTNVLREDIVTAALPLADTLRNAPESDGPFFKVPKVLGSDEDSAG